MIEILLTPFRMLITLSLGLTALVLPYRLRLELLQLIAAIVHLPFKAFGRLARYLLSQTASGADEANPYSQNPKDQS
ncbi:MAG TPA: hypothetical protein PLZ57_00020 [Pseudobdellovibrionaceae bacterium]|nr:hypothetical protein [Pseudobdellovibrionaceae bacterium]